MKKVIKKWGQGLGIYLDKEDSTIYELSEGDIIDFTIISINHKKTKKEEI